MKGEKTSYTVDPKSCVLTLYDGHLKALQQSIDGLLTLEKFTDSVLSQLVQLGFDIELEDKKKLSAGIDEEKTESNVDVEDDSVRMLEEGEGETSNPSKRSRLK